MSTSDYLPGRRVWLDARTIAAPAICYSWPAATITGTRWPYVLVDVDGQAHEVHHDNVRFRDPRETAGPTWRPVHRPVKALELAEGEKELKLW